MGPARGKAAPSRAGRPRARPRWAAVRWRRRPPDRSSPARAPERLREAMRRPPACPAAGPAEAPACRPGRRGLHRRRGPAPWWRRMGSALRASRRGSAHWRGRSPRQEAHPADRQAARPADRRAADQAAVPTRAAQREVRRTREVAPRSRGVPAGLPEAGRSLAVRVEGHKAKAECRAEHRARGTALAAERPSRGVAHPGEGRMRAAARRAADPVADPTPAARPEAAAGRAQGTFGAARPRPMRAAERRKKRRTCWWAGWKCRNAGTQSFEATSETPRNGVKTRRFQGGPEHSRSATGREAPKF